MAIASSALGLNLQCLVSIPVPEDIWQTWFETWFAMLQPDFEQALELTLRLTTNQEIQALNAQYRGYEAATDVLAFPALPLEIPEFVEADSFDQAGDEPLYLGDIVISVETATQQAAQSNHTLATELAWLASHGLLHLLGWDHPDRDALEAMMQKQAGLMECAGLPVVNWQEQILPDYSDR